MLLTAITFITALSISAVAIYYSVAGLMTIFAAAAIPIMIMGGILEISKLVTAVWLHRYWNESVWWLKTYLTAAVVVLMFITSMGIFGFLSKAHIEQTAGATSAEQVISRIDQDISILEQNISRYQDEITQAETKGTSRDQQIQQQITLEQQRIDTALARVQPQIDRQIEIIDRERSGNEGIIQQQLLSIEDNLSRLQQALQNNQNKTVQAIVGVPQDGEIGPNTRAAIEQYTTQQEQKKQQLLSELADIKSAPNKTVEAAEQEIKRIRSTVESEISESNQLINRLRTQLGQDDTEKVAEFVTEKRTRIDQNRNQISDLRDEKFQLETELRMLEVEVGPVKYIAELIYGDTDKAVLEQAVRWVILIIIFVFDPLAVLLLIASQYSYNLYLKQNKKVVINTNKGNYDDFLDLTEEKVFDEEQPKPVKKKKPVPKNVVRYSKKDNR